MRLIKLNTNVDTHVLIRPFKLADEATVIDLWTKLGLVSANNSPAVDIKQKLKVNPELFLVAELDFMVVGTLMGGYEGHRGWVNYLAVDPEFQRRGIARQLMHELETALTSRGCPKINLQVRTKNLAVLEFYKAIGYVQDEVISLGKRISK